MRRGAGNALAVAPLGVRRDTSAFRRTRDRIRIPTVSREARWVWLAVACFVAMSVWWLAQDSRVPDWDTGYHEYLAYALHKALSHGQLTAPFTQFTTYPPLVYLIGAMSAFVTG